MNTKMTADSDTSFQFGPKGRISALPEQRSLVSLSRWLSLPLVVALVLCVGISSSHAQDDDQQQKLKSLLRRFPEADADKDGKLSEDEARQYAPKLRGKVKTPPMDSTSSTHPRQICAT